MEPESHHKKTRAKRPVQVKCHTAVAAIAWMTAK
jgi:hypothetical protein